MIFNFGLLGILVMFILIYIYYSKELRDNDNGGKIFKGIMIINYLVELLYLGVYISIYDRSSFNFMLSKIYLFSLVFYNFLLIYYLINMVIRNKYKLQETNYEKKYGILRYSFVVVSILFFIILYLLPILYEGNMIFGVGVNFSYISIFVCNIICFIVMFANYRDIGIAKFKDMFVVSLINITFVIIQYYFNDINAINVGCVLGTLYMYLTLENSFSREVEELKLEKDSMARSTVDTTKFLTNMSYEIRTPLNAIDGLSQVILDSDNIDNIKEDAKDIRVASKNLVDIINGIIDISTIESGKMEIVNENYDVYTMFDNVCDIAKSRLKDSDIEFKIDIAKNIPSTLNGDSARIEQILINLLTNAIKYTKKGYILFKIDVINSASLCRLKMTVSDTGEGIKKEDINKLFSRFDSKESDGNKLGLVIVKKLVDLMNGKIDVESTYKKGSTFVVTIDQKVVNILEDNVDSDEKKRKLDVIDLSDKRILVVDDNKLNLKVANKLLSPYKVEIVEVMSGQECLDVLDEDTNFDLILMDDMMPNMSGSETLDVLLKLERVEGYHIPVVVLTANAISGMREKYLKAGFEDYLAKPIDKYELNRVLRKFLKKGKNTK